MVDGTVKSEGRIKDRLEGVISEMIERGILFPDAVSNFEKQFIAKVLKRHKGHISKTAGTLRMHRNTLSKKMEKYHLT
ncbi:MAG: histidine kinase [Acidobacteria bacterium]|nr:histidine kinase [Acidobacteriota bacterium]MBI3658004.1 histidine kinase [Acidobacteriota bacterium]